MTDAINLMVKIVVYAGIAAVLTHALRTYLARKIWRAQPGEVFNGDLFQVGEHLICCPDRSHLPEDAINQTTIVCFPGFLEDIRYFIALYRDVPARIIILNNGNYQNPFNDDTAVTKPAWVASNPYPLGIIAHDAYCLNLVLENMTSKERVVLHGHSRGGSVVLEAGHQKPDRASNTEALLEAAVVPQGRLVNKGESLLQPVGFYLMPLILSLLRILPESMRLKSPMMWVTNAAKNKHVAAIPFTPKQYATAQINLADILRFHSEASCDYYANFKGTTLFVGERDSVLSRSGMLESAKQSSAVDVIETQGTDHFISLERPDIIRAFFS